MTWIATGCLQHERGIPPGRSFHMGRIIRVKKRAMRLVASHRPCWIGEGQSDRHVSDSDAKKKED